MISARLPKDMIADLDKAAKMTGRTRNEIIQMSLEFALKNMEISHE
ncbi:MAG: CopG family transcriptional regulator [Clostridia bacterium]|nr:CopG family transcriptional regulator [Clostridia bacterium]